MPGFDGTGPASMGPMTGGRRGFCNPSWASYGPAQAKGAGYGRGLGRGYGRGRGTGLGRGRGFGWRGFSPLAGGWRGPSFEPGYGSPYNARPEDEIGSLRDEANYMKNELDAINRRIEELEKKA